MKSIVLAISLSLISSSAFAAACTSMMDGKKLVGAALTAHLKKCCEEESKTMKLAGAAADSHTKKCIADGSK